MRKGLFFVHLGCFLCSVEGVSVLLPYILYGAISVPICDILPFYLSKKKNEALKLELPDNKGDKMCSFLFFSFLSFFFLFFKFKMRNFV